MLASTSDKPAEAKPRVAHLAQLKKQEHAGEACGIFY